MKIIKIKSFHQKTPVFIIIFTHKGTRLSVGHRCQIIFNRKFKLFYVYKFFHKKLNKTDENFDNIDEFLSKNEMF